MSRFSLMRVTMMIDIDVQQDQSDSNPNLGITIMIETSADHIAQLTWANVLIVRPSYSVHQKRILEN